MARGVTSCCAQLSTNSYLDTVPYYESRARPVLESRTILKPYNIMTTCSSSKINDQSLEHWGAVGVRIKKKKC
eukprot:scaffold8677_cov38-Attheya_sp.AAC.1